MPERKRFLLRLDPRLYGALEKWAADELRSVNSQIEFLLGEAAKRAGRAPKAAAEPVAADSRSVEESGPGGSPRASDGVTVRILDEDSK